MKVRSKFVSDFFLFEHSVRDNSITRIINPFKKSKMKQIELEK